MSRGGEKRETTRGIRPWRRATNQRGVCAAGQSVGTTNQPVGLGSPPGLSHEHKICKPFFTTIDIILNGRCLLSRLLYTPIKTKTLPFLPIQDFV